MNIVIWLFITFRHFRFNLQRKKRKEEEGGEKKKRRKKKTKDKPPRKRGRKTGKRFEEVNEEKQKTELAFLKKQKNVIVKSTHFFILTIENKEEIE